MVGGVIPKKSSCAGYADFHRRILTQIARGQDLFTIG
jgi:hypothetical protein